MTENKDLRFSREWIKKLTKTQHNKLEKWENFYYNKSEKLETGVMEMHYAMDFAANQVANNVLPPFDFRLYPLSEHFRSINKELFMMYPYGFGKSQIKELIQRTDEHGFDFHIDSFASRFKGGNTRVIVWKSK